MLKSDSFDLPGAFLSFGPNLTLIPPSGLRALLDTHVDVASFGEIF